MILADELDATSLLNWPNAMDSNVLDATTRSLRWRHEFESSWGCKTTLNPFGRQEL
jgi:hypothetical protein